jgi:hypothetical protein
MPGAMSSALLTAIGRRHTRLSVPTLPALIAPAWFAFESTAAATASAIAVAVQACTGSMAPAVISGIGARWAAFGRTPGRGRGLARRGLADLTAAADHRIGADGALSAGRRDCGKQQRNSCQKAHGSISEMLEYLSRMPAVDNGVNLLHVSMIVADHGVISTRACAPALLLSSPFGPKSSTAAAVLFGATTLAACADAIVC